VLDKLIQTLQIVVEEKVTYKVFVVTNGSGYFFNRPETTSDTSDQVEGVSTLTAMEVVG
jgi:hypothetical protein